jgi:hypothetical protein
MLGQRAPLQLFESVPTGANEDKMTAAEEVALLHVLE